MHGLTSLHQYQHKLSSVLQNGGHPKINKVDVQKTLKLIVNKLKVVTYSVQFREYTLKTCGDEIMAGFLKM